MIGRAPHRSGSMVADARWVGGVYPLIHPEAADLGGASVRLKVRCRVLKPVDAHARGVWCGGMLQIAF